MNNEGKANDTINSVASSKPEVKDAMPSGNIVWKALKKVDRIDDDYRELLMSMVGTTIFRTNAVTTPETKPAKEINLEEFIGGNVADADENPLDSMDFVIYKCDERAECLNPYDAQFDPDHTKQSFKAMIRKKVNDVIANLRDRTADPDPSGTMKFLNATDIPIYKIVAVTTSLGNTAMADNAMARYQELIAAKYAQVYIQRAVSDLARAELNPDAKGSIPQRAAALDENVHAFASPDKEIGAGRANPAYMTEQAVKADMVDFGKKLWDKVTGGDGMADGEKLNENKRRETSTDLQVNTPTQKQ